MEQLHFNKSNGGTNRVGIRLWWFLGNGGSVVVVVCAPLPTIFGFFRMLLSGGIVAARGGSPCMAFASSNGAEPALSWRCMIGAGAAGV